MKPTDNPPRVEGNCGLEGPISSKNVVISKISEKLAGWSSQRPIETIMMVLLILTIASVSLLRHFSSEVKFQMSRKVYVDSYGNIGELTGHEQTSLAMRQVIISAPRLGTSQGVLCRDILYGLFEIQELIESLPIGGMKENALEPDEMGVKKRPLTYKELCYRPNRRSNKECLVISPLLYWKNDRDLFSRDSHLLRTLSNSATIVTPLGGLNLSSVFRGIRQRKSDHLITGAEALILTYFFNMTSTQTEAVDEWVDAVQNLHLDTFTYDANRALVQVSSDDLYRFWDTIRNAPNREFYVVLMGHVLMLAIIVSLFMKMHRLNSRCVLGRTYRMMMNHEQFA